MTPWEIWRKAAEIGLTGFMLPEEYGGGGFTDRSASAWCKKSSAPATQGSATWLRPMGSSRTR